MKKTQNLTTAGGKIVCSRCQATSKRTKLQCGRPALKGKSVCNFHGGRSTGPKTPEGKERSRQAHIKSGEFSQVSRQRRSADSLTLAYLEDMMHATNMTSQDRTRGRKPTGYTKLTSLTELMEAIKANEVH